jgi:cell division protein FtsZ
MGTGRGSGDNRSIDAAQQAISSPLLDNLSIAGARGVLINITGGADMGLGEVTQISEIIKDAVGEESEIIFGAVPEPAMQGEIRVTVIATGFDARNAMPTPEARTRGAPVIPLPVQRQARVAALPPRPPVAASDRPAARPAQRTGGDVNDMEIPTFIRRQMD